MFVHANVCRAGVITANYHPRHTQEHVRHACTRLPAILHIPNCDSQHTRQVQLGQVLLVSNVGSDVALLLGVRNVEGGDSLHAQLSGVLVGHALWLHARTVHTYEQGKLVTEDHLGVVNYCSAHRSADPTANTQTGQDKRAVAVD